MSIKNKPLTAGDFTVGEWVRVKEDLNTKISAIKDMQGCIRKVFHITEYDLKIPDNEKDVAWGFTFYQVEKLDQSRITVNTDGTASYREESMESVTTEEIVPGDYVRHIEDKKIYRVKDYFKDTLCPLLLEDLSGDIEGWFSIESVKKVEFKPTTEEIKTDEIDFSKIQKGDKVWVEVEVNSTIAVGEIGSFHKVDFEGVKTIYFKHDEIVHHLPAETITIEEAEKILGKKIKN